MARNTLLIIFSVAEENIISDILKRFYKFSMTEIPDIDVDDNNFSTILYDPSPKNLFKSLDAETLIFIISKSNKMGYMGVGKDVFSRELSIEIPTALNWNELVECSKQTPQSLISFI
jgi:hypothetical protein